MYNKLWFIPANKLYIMKTLKIQIIQSTCLDKYERVLWFSENFKNLVHKNIQKRWLFIL